MKMKGISEKDEDNIFSMRENIQAGLQNIDFDGNWYDDYLNWRKDDRNSFDSLLTINNPFNLSCVGDRVEFNLSDPKNIRDLDIFCMSVFLSEKVRITTQKVFDYVRTERIREKKVKRIEEYFELLRNIVDDPQLSGCIVTLNDLAEKQMVLFGSRSVDFYAAFFSLREVLRRESVESLYLLLTYWRIGKSRKSFKELTNSIISYIQTYFEEFDKDPEMHLYYPMDGLMSVKKMAAVMSWLELIAFHTNGIFEKYQELKWLVPADRMADDIIETNQISRFEMMQYRRIFHADDEKTVQKKATCNHGYAIWIKTVDIMYIVSDIFQILYHFNDDELKKMGTSKAAMLEGYDNMIKIRDYYTGKVFFHRVYFQLERHYLDSQVMEALEQDAEDFSRSIDSVLDFVNAIASDDIESLMQAKQRYIGNTEEYISESQEDKLDDLTAQVVEKIKATIQKLSVYDELYRSVSAEFAKYAVELMKHPQIFSSLVSAEYLYRQYVLNRKPINNFDYSCISIMYYMSLEDFINKLVYIPYANEVLSKLSKNKIKDKKWKDEEACKYVSSVGAFWDKCQRLKKSCEIGVLGYLFEAVPDEDYFKKFLTDHFGEIDTNQVERFGTKLKKIAPRRNDAAHGGNYLTYEDVCTDKDNIYNTVIDNYRGMILELMGICFDR